MTRKDAYPSATLVWNAQGEEITQRIVPAFEAKPGAAVLYHVE
ncbi:hypothetical protein [Xanthomonas sp. NCPPB 2632]